MQLCIQWLQWLQWIQWLQWLQRLQWLQWLIFFKSHISSLIFQHCHYHQNVCPSQWEHVNVWKLKNQFPEKKDLLCWTRRPAQLPIQVFNLKHRTGLVVHTRTPSNIILYILLSRALWFVWWFDFSLSLLYQALCIQLHLMMSNNYWDGTHFLRTNFKQIK